MSARLRSRSLRQHELTAEILGRPLKPKPCGFSPTERTIHFKFERILRGRLYPKSRVKVRHRSKYLFDVADGDVGFGLSPVPSGDTSWSTVHRQSLVKTDSGIGTAMDDMMIEPAVITESNIIKSSRPQSREDSRGCGYWSFRIGGLMVAMA